MKNLMCLLLLVAFLTTSTFAQRKGMAIKADNAVEQMTTELDLTPEQQVKIKAIYETRIADRKSRNAQTREERIAIRTEFNEKIEAVLTPAQIEKKKALKEAHKEDMRAQREQRKADGPGKKRSGKKGKKVKKSANMSPEMIENRAVRSTEKLDKQVNLTEAQQGTIKTAYLNFYQKNQAIATDTSLDAAAKKEMLTQLKKEHKHELKSLLTEEQMDARKNNKKRKKAKNKEKQQ